MKKKSHKLRNFLILWALILVVALGYYVYTETSVFIIEFPIITGTTRVQDYEVFELLKMGEGLHFFETNQYDLESRVNNHPYVRSCKVEKTFPNQLTISIIERVPVASMFYTDRYLIVDEDLVIVEVSETSEDYFPIYGFKFNSFQQGQVIRTESKDLLTRTMNLVFMLNAHDFSHEMTLRIENEEINVYFSEDFKARFGDGQNIESRFSVMYEIYKTLLLDGDPSGTINVSHDGPAILKPFGD